MPFLCASLPFRLSSFLGFGRSFYPHRPWSFLFVFVGCFWSLLLLCSSCSGRAGGLFVLVLFVLVLFVLAVIGSCSPSSR